MALLMVIITVAVLSAIVVDFIHQSRINLQMAANVRDRMQATYLARSAINFSRLILSFQGQIDQATQGTVKLYQLIPIESDLAKAFTSGEMGEAFGLKGLSLGTHKGFGEFEGKFSATIEDEYTKVNPNALVSMRDYVQWVTAGQILALTGNQRFRPMFEVADADGQHNTPQDIVVAIKDWADEDTSMDQLNQERIAGDTSAGGVFRPGTASEDSRYDMLADPYQNKNLPFFSVDELYMIRGIGDDFMEEFGERFTVYTDAKDTTLNLNSVNDPLTLISILCMQPENLKDCATEQGLAKILETVVIFFETRNVMQQTTFSVMPTNLIIKFFTEQGIKISADFVSTLKPTSDTFSIQATGEVGDVKVNVRAVVKNRLGGQEIVYFRVM